MASRRRPDRGRAPEQGEALAVWGLLVADLLAVLVVYSVVDPRELHNVSHEGIAGGSSRALVQLNFPIALIAIPIVVLAVSVLPRRAWFAGGPAIALCASVAVPGVLDQDDLDARPVNVVGAVGVVLALALSVAATRRAGAGFAPGRPGDRWRIAAALVVIAVSLPWFTAEAGFHLPGGIFLTDDLYAEPGEPPTASVHLGHHHGFAGALFVLSVLLLSRTSPLDAATRRAYSALVSLALVYGATNLVQDLWHEQVVKREWTSWDVPSALFPALSPMWGLMLTLAAIVFLLGFARRAAPASGDNHRI